MRSVPVMQYMPVSVQCSFVLVFHLVVSEHYTFLAAAFRPNTQSNMQIIIMHLMTGIKTGGCSKFYNVELHSWYLLE